MKEKKPKKFSSFKKKKPLVIKVADDLVKLHERNEQLRKRPINPDVLDLFK